MKNILIGTSGWNYEDWEGNFYPRNIKSSKMLSFYQRYFKTVEVNNTFYQSPTKNKLMLWKRQVGNNFTFSVKANRYITHMKNLKDPEEPINKMLSTLKILKNNLGPILFQLPPRWHINKKRLNNFLKILPPNYQYVLEFRHSSWYKSSIFDLLEKFNIAFCMHDHKDAPSPEKITANFSYFRFHGPKGDYQTKYSKKEVKNWAEKIKRIVGKNIDVYVYFNNDYNSYAIKNAKQLKKLLS